MIDELVPEKEKTTKKLRCKCHQLFQDERYGPGIRLHNRMAKGDRGIWWRCTGCGKERQK